MVIRLSFIGALLLAVLCVAAPKSKASADAGTIRDAGVLFEPFVWDIPDIIEVVDVQGRMETAGIPTRASAVRTKAKGEALVFHIFSSFKRYGLFIPPPARMTQIDTLPQLTGYDTIRQIGYTAMFQANPDGTTTLILSETNLAGRKQPYARGRVPLPSDASRVLKSSVEGVEVVSYYTALPPLAVGQLYGGYAADAGMSLEGADTNQLAFSGESGALTVAATVQGDAGTRVTVVDRRGP